MLKVGWLELGSTLKVFIKIMLYARSSHNSHLGMRTCWEHSVPQAVTLRNLEQASFSAKQLGGMAKLITS